MWKKKHTHKLDSNYPIWWELKFVKIKTNFVSRVIVKILGQHLGQLILTCLEWMELKFIQRVNQVIFQMEDKATLWKYITFSNYCLNNGLNKTKILGYIESRIIQMNSHNRFLGKDYSDRFKRIHPRHFQNHKVNINQTLNNAFWREEDAFF